MIAFEVFANNHRVCTAGLEGRHVLTVIVQSVPRTLRPGDKLSKQELQLLIGGLAADTETHHRMITRLLSETRFEFECLTSLRSTHRFKIDPCD